MPPVFHDLDLEPWTSGEQAAAPLSRPFQHEAVGTSATRTEYLFPETNIDRRRGQLSNRVPSNGPRIDADHPQISKRKQQTAGSTSPPEQSTSKRQKNLSDTELGVIRLAASILQVPVSSLLAAHTEAQGHSEGSSTTHESIETPSTGPERIEGSDIPVEISLQPAPRQHPAPTSAPSLQPVNGFESTTNAGYSELPTFRNDIDVNSKVHLEWWGLNPSLIFDDFESPAPQGQKTDAPIHQELSSHPSDWGHTRFGEEALESGPTSNNVPAWTSIQQGPPNTYVTSHDAAEVLQHPISFAIQPQPHASQVFGPSIYDSNVHTESRVMDMSAEIMEFDENYGIDRAGTRKKDTVSNHNVVNGGRSNIYTPRRPRQSRKVNHDSESRRPGRRGPLTDEQRLATSLTRKRGACIRCQRQAIKARKIFLIIQVNKLMCSLLSVNLTPWILMGVVLPAAKCLG